MENGNESRCQVTPSAPLSRHSSLAQEVGETISGQPHQEGAVVVEGHFRRLQMDQHVLGEPLQVM